MRTQWPSPAKLNLFLYITGQRADGYHTLQTLFQFLDYGDTISIELRDDGDIRLLTPVEGVEHEDNLIVRAARLLMKTAADSGRLPTGSGANISIDKRLPMGGGLGGISSGQQIIAHMALKPTSSITVPGRTINRFGEEVEMITKGRHDPCVGIRAVPIAEAMLAIVLMDHLLRQRAQNADVKTDIPRW